MKKKITIEEILNGLPENNLFINVELKSVKNNISLLNRIYSEGLLSKLLDEYFAYRKKTTNYYKIIEFLQTINNYISLLEGNDFSGNFININDDNLDIEFEKLKYKLHYAFENTTYEFF